MIDRALTENHATPPHIVSPEMESARQASYHATPPHIVILEMESTRLASYQHSSALLKILVIS